MWYASRVSFLFGVLPLRSSGVASAIWTIHSRWLQRRWLQERWLPFYIFTVLGFLGWWEFTVYVVFRPDLREFRTDRALNILARYATTTGLVPRYVLSWNPFLLPCSGVTSCFSVMSLAILLLVSMCFWSFHSFAVANAFPLQCTFYRNRLEFAELTLSLVRMFLFSSVL